jgi:DNA-binding transcriptional regulator YiaG
MNGGDVRALREALGLTQAEMGAALKMSPLSVLRWENGQARPSRLARRALERLKRRIARRKGT